MRALVEQLGNEWVNSPVAFDWLKVSCSQSNDRNINPVAQPEHTFSDYDTR